MLKGTIDLLILSTLALADNYGYEISKEIKDRTEGMFEIQEASLYLSLKRLEKIIVLKHIGVLKVMEENENIIV